MQSTVTSTLTWHNVMDDAIHHHT